MTLFFFIQERNIAYIISHVCEKMGYSCSLFFDTEIFFATLKKPIKKPDLVICDYMICNHSMFNVYSYLKRQETIFPLIFYNDPFADGFGRVAYWECTMQTVIGSKFDADKYREIFSIIAETVESENLKPYISLLQPAKKFPADAIISQSYAGICSEKTLDLLTARLSLSGTMMLLFGILYKNRDKNLAVEEMQEKLRQMECSIKTKTVYAVIMRLRKKLEAHADIKANIINTPNGYRLLIDEP